jgi:endonuclease YncB( thermonuclease family)
MQRLTVPCLLLLLTLACKTEFHSNVIQVVDGDTLVVANASGKTTIRLYGIDSPEYNQPFGNEAREFTKRVAMSQNVRIEALNQDDYGRTVAKVYLPDNSYLNARIIEAGYAWWFRRYAPNEKLLQTMEEEARSARRGLWSRETPQEPWNFRRPETAMSAPSNSPVAITHLHCNGTGVNEPDEYVELQNLTSNAIDLTGWTLHDEGRKHALPFPPGFRLEPKQQCRVYTNQHTGCLSFEEDKSAIWNNFGDRAYLLDPSHQIVSSRPCD